MGDRVEIRGEGLTNPKKANTFRVLPKKGKIVIEFGRMSKNKVTVLSSIWITPESLIDFLGACLESGLFYQEIFETDIGFKIPDLNEDKGDVRVD